MVVTYTVKDVDRLTAMKVDFIADLTKAVAKQFSDEDTVVIIDRWERELSRICGTSARAWAMAGAMMGIFQ